MSAMNHSTQEDIVVYDEIMLLCARARQRDLWHEVQQDALIRRAQAARPQRYERWLLRFSHVLILWGLKLRALCRPPLAHPVSTSLKLLECAEQPPGHPATR